MRSAAGRLLFWLPAEQATSSRERRKPTLMPMDILRRIAGDALGPSLASDAPLS